MSNSRIGLVELMFTELKNRSAELGLSRILLTETRVGVTHVLPHFYDDIDLAVLISRASVLDSPPAWGEVFCSNVKPFLWMTVIAIFVLDAAIYFFDARDVKRAVVNALRLLLSVVGQGNFVENPKDDGSKNMFVQAIHQCFPKTLLNY